MNAPHPVTGDALATLLLVGPPNAGKSTLFNRLTGGFASTGNVAGTTVRAERARLTLGPQAALAVDLPGTASLVAHAADEEVTLRSLLELASGDRHGAVLLVLDAPRLARSLYLALQVLALELPTVVALNLADEARAAGRAPDAAALQALLGVPVVLTSARSGEGEEALRSALASVLAAPGEAVARLDLPLPAALEADADAVVQALPAWARSEGHPRRARELALWALQSELGAREAGRPLPEEVLARVHAAAAQAGRDLDAEIAAARYAWIDARLPAVLGEGPTGPDLPSATSEALDGVLLHPLFGSVAFFAVMWLVFSALFSWSDPLVGAIEGAQGVLADGVRAAFGEVGGGAAILRDLLVDGVIGGVGAVLVFLPQIAVLFALLAVLEDCGYLARAAALMDRILRLAGLPGQAFVPLLSGFACAVPAIMATRSIPRRRDRLVTMAVLPLTTCSARLPVYVLVIGALFPATVGAWGVDTRPLALLGLYVFSTLATLGAAIVVGRFVLPSPATAAVLELPPYRRPDPRAVLRTVALRCGEFVREAGRIILVATVVLWALLAFPRYTPEEVVPPDELAAAEARGDDLASVAAPYALERSFAGRLGHAIEPAIAPLGFDWKIGVGLIGAFAAREVFVSTLGVVYGVADATEEDPSLRAALRNDRRPDGSAVVTPLTGVSVLVFFALAMQCLSTLAVLRKESGGWAAPLGVMAYMTVLAYALTLAVYQAGRALGFA